MSGDHNMYCSGNQPDIVERLRGYNPPDRTLDSQRQIAIDIHEAADEIERLLELVEKMETALRAVDDNYEECVGADERMK
jgi:hypothetical protein